VTRSSLILALAFTGALSRSGGARGPTQQRRLCQPDGSGTAEPPPAAAGIAQRAGRGAACGARRRGNLFALHGIDTFFLRDIAAKADVHLALIRRYVGTREELVLAVFDYLSDQVARAVAENPLSGQGVRAGHGHGKRVRVIGALIIAGRGWVLQTPAAAGTAAWW
jgi:AcrR family transcriptional regulator